jgi:hypothetical protein
MPRSEPRSKYDTAAAPQIETKTSDRTHRPMDLKLTLLFAIPLPATLRPTNCNGSLSVYDMPRDACHSPDPWTALGEYLLRWGFTTTT